jgi:hypothetical protein
VQVPDPVQLQVAPLSQVYVQTFETSVPPQLMLQVEPVRQWMFETLVWYPLVEMLQVPSQVMESGALSLLLMNEYVHVSPAAQKAAPAGLEL